MTRLLQSGFSRIPLHAGAVEGVDRYLIVKEHILLDPDDAAPVAGLRAYSPVWVAPDASLFQALNTFQTGRTHMAFVSARVRATTTTSRARAPRKARDEADPSRPLHPRALPPDR